MPKVWWIWVMLGCGWGGLRGQAPQRKVRVPVRAAATVPVGTSGALLDMEARAAVIFAGRVVTVDREDEAGYVDVSFRVDEPVRGCSKLGMYVLREWAGLWSGGAPRYVVGQRRLMLLAGRGPGGMSAPVDGQDGAIPIVPNATEPLADGPGVAPREDGSDGGDVTAMTADLRWVAAHVARNTVADARGADGRVTDAGVKGQPGIAVEWRGLVAPVTKAAVEPSVGAVLALLRGSAAGADATADGSGHEAR